VCIRCNSVGKKSESNGKRNVSKKNKSQVKRNNNKKQKSEKTKKNDNKKVEKERKISGTCPACQKFYFEPPENDLIECKKCKKWYHEICTSYEG
jgi:ribosomal protein L37AE/L43A